MRRRARVGSWEVIHRAYFQIHGSRLERGKTLFRTLDTNRASPVGVAAELPKEDMSVEQLFQAWWELQDLVQIFQFISGHSP